MEKVKLGLIGLGLMGTPHARILKKVEELVSSDNSKVKMNSIITLGFKMMSNKELINRYLPIFFQNLQEQNSDINENIYFFLHKVVEADPNLICSYKDKIIEKLRAEQDQDNIFSLFNYLEHFKDYTFEELFDLKEICKMYVNRYFHQRDSLFFKKIKQFIIKAFPSLNRDEFWEDDVIYLLKAFDEYILVKKQKKRIRTEIRIIRQRTNIS